MGGPGSGGYRYRWNKRRTLEEFRALKITKLREDGMLQPGLRWNVIWGDAGSIWLTAFSDKLVLEFNYNGESTKQLVELDYTPCNYGGLRSWFKCECGRRVGVLYAAGRYFKCRRCYPYPYTCQQEGRSDRAARQIRKIQRRLTNPDYSNVIDPWFPQPKYMHRKTYDRIIAKAHKHMGVFNEEMRKIVRLF